MKRDTIPKVDTVSSSAFPLSATEAFRNQKNPTAAPNSSAQPKLNSQILSSTSNSTITHNVEDATKNNRNTSSVHFMRSVSLLAVGTFCLIVFAVNYRGKSYSSEQSSAEAISKPPDSAPEKLQEPDWLLKLSKNDKVERGM